MRTSVSKPVSHEVVGGPRVEVARSPTPALPTRLARTAVHRRLAGLREGRLAIEDFGGVGTFGADSDLAPAMLRVLDPRFYPRVVTGGALGFAESYLRGEWTSPDLAAVLRVLARNVARHAAGGWTHAAFARPLARLAHWARRNTRAGSRRNIREHYDLGNEFYALFLDDTMTYSCGVFEHPASTLREASIAKLDRVCRRLGLNDRHHVLEIGGGWGSFALHAAGHYGCRVTTTTISAEQRRLALERVAAAGLADRVEVLAEDYRDLRGTYDRVVSIEMIEAVGHDHLPEYFRACAARLRPDGTMLLQAITMPDRDYARYLGSVDYIQRYVFPGSNVPSLGAIVGAAATAGLRVAQVESIGPHYAETLRRWRAAFRARLPEVRALGFDERFVRLWDYYLCYCEAGFDEGYVDDLQIVLARSDHSAPPFDPAVGTASGSASMRTAHDSAAATLHPGEDA